MLRPEPDLHRHRRGADRRAPRVEAGARRAGHRRAAPTTGSPSSTSTRSAPPSRSHPRRRRPRRDTADVEPGILVEAAARSSSRTTSDRIGPGPGRAGSRAPSSRTSRLRGRSAAGRSRGRAPSTPSSSPRRDLGPGRGLDGQPLLRFDPGADHPRRGPAGDPPGRPEPACTRISGAGARPVGPPRAPDVDRARGIARTGARDRAAILHVPGRRVRRSVQARCGARVRRRRCRSIAPRPSSSAGGAARRRGGAGAQRTRGRQGRSRSRVLSARSRPAPCSASRPQRHPCRRVDLADALAPAYEAFAGHPRRPGMMERWTATEPRHARRQRPRGVTPVLRGTRLATGGEPRGRVLLPGGRHGRRALGARCSSRSTAA